MKEEEALTAWKRYLSLKGRKHPEVYLANAREFLVFLSEGGKGHDQAAPGDAEEYRAMLLTEKGLARATANNKVWMARGFYLFLRKRRLIAADPFRGLKGLKTGKSIPKNILSAEEMGKLLDGFAIVRLTDFMLKSLAELLYGSSLRVGEAAALKTEDIDFSGGSLTVTNAKEGGGRWKCPATEVSLREARKYMEIARDRLLSGEDLRLGYLYPQGGRTTLRCMLNAKLARECRRLELKPITSHCFRHSSATHMLRAGAGIREVQMLLGHARITSTQTYLRVVKEDLKTVIGRYHPRERRNGE